MTHPEIDPDRAYLVSEAAKLLPNQRRDRKGVGTCILYRWMKSGKNRFVTMTLAGRECRRILGSDILREWEVKVLGPELPQTREMAERRYAEVRRRLREEHGL